MGQSSNPYLANEQKHFLHTFKRQPLLIKKAQGAFVWDEKGHKYLDFFSGLAVCGVGHNDPRVVKAAQKQAGLLLHSSNYFYTEPQNKLAAALTARWKDSHVFFCNSGAEANELCIKLARLWATKTGKPGREIVVFQNAFHGRTIATAAASQGASRSHAYFEPLPAGFKSVPYNDLGAVKKAVNRNTIGIWLEPVQGEGGIHVASPAFLRGIAKICRERKLLLLFDEVQSGMGRTGKFFAFEHYGVKPDVVTLAKGIAGGLPLGAVLAAPRVAEHMVPGLHGSTFGGNPVACAAALEVLKIVSSKALRSIERTGKDILRQLEPFRRYPVVKEIRALGLMIGIELHEEGDPYVSLARERGLLINCTQRTVLRFLPPYFISKAELHRSLEICVRFLNRWPGAERGFNNSRFKRFTARRFGAAVPAFSTAAHWPGII